MSFKLLIDKKNWKTQFLRPQNLPNLINFSITGKNIQFSLTVSEIFQHEDRSVVLPNRQQFTQLKRVKNRNSLKFRGILTH